MPEEKNIQYSSKEPWKRKNKRMPWELPLERFFRKHPALRFAFKEVEKHFAKSNGVRGIGLGCRYKESEQRYDDVKKHFDGLCIKIYLTEKIDPKKLPQSQLIPRSLKMTLPNSKKQVEVPIDVITTGNPELQLANESHLSGRYKHKWPTNEKNYFEPGRLITYSKKPMDMEEGKFEEERERRLGTIGAIIKGSDDRYYAISAAHVFLAYCNGQYEVDNGRHGVGVRYNHWIRLGYGAEMPERIIDSHYRIFDVMGIRLPWSSNLIKKKDIQWPPSFKGKLAGSDDYNMAIRSTSPTAFLWIERRGNNVKLPCDVDGGLPYFQSKSCGSGHPYAKYPFVWPVRFKKDTQTVDGDSGASLFIPAAKGNEVKLLGFHFMYNKKTRLGYSMFARSFFRRLEWNLGENFVFPNLSRIL